MIEKIYKKYLEFPAISIDSRNASAGSIFFALKGENFDGNQFAKSALESGAKLAVIDDPKYVTEGCILVDNSLRTLQQLANYHRKQLGLRVIGITGSNGKTTTKELLFAVLSQKFQVYATKGNLNNHIGVPLTLLALTKETDIAIVEMGANHPGDIRELVEVAEPNFGIITNIGRAHLGGFGSFEGVINTKSELYQYIVQSGGTVFYNQDNQILNQLIEKFRLQDNAIKYGDICKNIEARNIDQNPFLNLRLNITGFENPVDLKTSLVGNYNVENILAAITVGRYFGVDLYDIQKAIEEYVPTNSRSQFLKTAHNTIIVDAYNANPSSMEMAIRNFASIEGKNKLAILGEMLELGDYSVEEHRHIVQLIIKLKVNNVILVGSGFHEVKENFLYFDNSEECTKYIRGNPIFDSTILLKGSRGVKLEKVLEYL